MDPSRAPTDSRDQLGDDRDGTHRQPGRRDRPSTMKDIALATGVSRSTVSRILNDTPLTVPIAKETRERVLAAARDLEYRPNPLARALRGARRAIPRGATRAVSREDGLALRPEGADRDHLTGGEVTARQSVALT